MKKLLIGGLIFGSISSFAQIDYLAQMYVDNSNYEKKTPVKICKIDNTSNSNMVSPRTNLNLADSDFVWP